MSGSAFTDASVDVRQVVFCTAELAMANEKKLETRTNPLEQVPPHDEASEAAALGAMLIDPRAADIVIEELKPDDFYVPRHRLLFKLLSEIFQKQEVLDEVYICSELQRQGQLEAVGGRDMIGRLIIDTPGAAGVEGYCTIIRSRAVERELLAGAGAILRLLQEPSSADTAELVEQAEKVVYDISDKRSGQDAVPMVELMSATLAEAEKIQTARRAGLEIPSPALPTNFVELDRILSGGLWPGELIIVAGRPSMGKTTFAMNIVRKISVGNEKLVKPTAVFSLEMPKEQVAKNILAAHKQLQGHKLRRLDLDEHEFEALQWGIREIGEAPIFIDDTSAISLSQLRARCRRLRHRKDIRLVVVDYLQLMKTAGTKNGNREQEVAELSRGLKALARDLSIPIIVLSQLNRSAEKRENDDKRPQLSDLRESGAIEQDADVVIMLYRSEYYDINQNANSKNVGEALILKNRNGPVGQVKLTFLKDILRFESFSPEDMAAGE